MLNSKVSAYQDVVTVTIDRIDLQVKLGLTQIGSIDDTAYFIVTPLAGASKFDTSYMSDLYDGLAQHGYGPLMVHDRNDEHVGRTQILQGKNRIAAMFKSDTGSFWYFNPINPRSDLGDSNILDDGQYILVFPRMWVWDGEMIVKKRDVR